MAHEYPLYIVDQENVSYQPQTCNEAIILFNRMKRKNQLLWDYVPETLQKLAKDLPPEEHDRFCEWVCNPTEIKPGHPGYFSELQRLDEENQKGYQTDDEKGCLPLANNGSSRPTPADHNTPCDMKSGNDDISVVQDTPPAPAEL